MSGSRARSCPRSTSSVDGHRVASVEAQLGWQLTRAQQHPAHSRLPRGGQPSALAGASRLHASLRATAARRCCTRSSSLPRACPSPSRSMRSCPATGAHCVRALTSGWSSFPPDPGAQSGPSRTAAERGRLAAASAPSALAPLRRHLTVVFSRLKRPASPEVDAIMLGDNLELLPRFAAESFQLIYIDPPFNTGSAQTRRTLRTVADEDGDRTGFQGSPLLHRAAGRILLSRLVRGLSGASSCRAWRRRAGS